MKTSLTALGAIALTTGASLAGGIERAPQSLAPLFESGNYVELSFGGVDPTVSGQDIAGFSTGDVAQGYGFVGLAYKHQFTDALSAAFIIEQPFGADILYPMLPAPSPEFDILDGTRVRVDSTTYTALLRYKFDNLVSVHGGLRGSHAKGQVTLAGRAYQDPDGGIGLDGYNLDLSGAWGAGWTAGVAYEIPEVAARISLTYNSPIEHNFEMTETGGSLPIAFVDKYKVRTPRSWVLEGQTGIADDTLLFGSIRWVNWSEFKVNNFVFPAEDQNGAEVPLVEVEDTTTYTIGVGRQFNDQWAGSASFLYEPRQSGRVSPLSPTNGRKAITLAAVYSMDNIKLTTGINYTKLGSAVLGIGPSDESLKETVAKMTDSDAWGIGMKVGYSF